MLDVNFSPFPTLATERLELRAITRRDAPALFALRRDERVMRLIARPLATSLEDVLTLISEIDADLASNSGITWAVTLRGDDNLIGTIGFYRLKKEHYRGEIGYLLDPAHWGRGVMSEAVEAVVEFGFGRLRFHSIEANTDPRNTASRKLLERCGFILEGLFKEDYYCEGQFLDSAIYSRLSRG